MGVDLSLSLSFLVTNNVAILSFTIFVLVTFRDLLTRNPIPNCLFLFLSRSLRLEKFFYFSSTESVFGSWIPRMSTFFRAKTTSMSLSFGITPRTFQDPMLNPLEKRLLEIWAFRMPEQPSRYASSGSIASFYFHLQHMNMSFLNLNKFFRIFFMISDGPSPNHRWPGMSAMGLP